MKPATPVPWEISDSHGLCIHKDEIGIADIDSREFSKPLSEVKQRKNAAYIVHACNNFPRLVEALRAMIEEHVVRCPTLNNAETLLRDLGEL